MAQLPIDPAFPLWLPSSCKGNRNPMQSPLLWAMLPTHLRSLQNLLSSSSRDLETKWIDTVPGTNSRPGFSFSFFLMQVRAAPFFFGSYKTESISFLGLRKRWGRWARNTECGPSTSPSLYCIVTVKLTINTTVGSEAPAV